MIPKDPKEMKQTSLRFLRGFFETLYPSSEDMKKDYLISSKSLRKVLRALEVILESSDFDRLDIGRKFDSIVARMEESEEETEEFKKASSEMKDLVEPEEEGDYELAVIFHDDELATVSWQLDTP